jgi:hypothetical protein
MSVRSIVWHILPTGEAAGHFISFSLVGVGVNPGTELLQTKTRLSQGILPPFLLLFLVQESSGLQINDWY